MPSKYLFVEESKALRKASYNNEKVVLYNNFMAVVVV